MSQTTREAVERPDDDHGRVLNPILDAAYWRKQT